MSNVDFYGNRVGLVSSIFAIAVFLFCWPFLASPDQWSASELFIFLFSSWFLLVLIMFAFAQKNVSESINPEDNDV